MYPKTDCHTWEHLIQQRNDPAFAVSAGIYQYQTIASELPHSHDDFF